jgi:antiviral helicase SKI2
MYPSQLISSRYKSAGESLRRKQDKEREAAGLPPVQRTGGRGGAPTSARDLPTGRGTPHTRIGAGRAHVNRGGGNGAPAPAVAPPTRGRGGGFGPPTRGGFNLDQNVWTHLITHLKKNSLLPVVNFVFSKKRCEEYANNLGQMDLCDAKEKSEVHITWERALSRLKGRSRFAEKRCLTSRTGGDRTLPQITRMRELLGRGIGIHHGGLLPLVKGQHSLSTVSRLLMSL